MDRGFNIIRAEASKRGGESKRVFDELIKFIKYYTGIEESFYFYPLAPLKKGIPVRVYDLDKIYKEKESIAALENVLNVCGIEKAMLFQMQAHALELNEVDLKKLIYEKDGEEYNFPWMEEAFYFDNIKNWLMYVSHEGTITFAGEKLVKTAEEFIDEKYKAM